MQRRTLAGLLAGILLATLAACGSPKPGTFHPAGSTLGPSPSSAVHQAVHLAGPTPFPGKLTFQFDALPANPRQAALVSTDRQWQYDYYDAIYTRNVHGSYTSYLGHTSTRPTVISEVTLAVAAHRGYAGVVRYFGTTVTPVASYPGEMSVNYCVDESGMHRTNIRTGRVTGPTSPPYYVEHDWFAKGPHGRWRVVGTQVIPYSPGSPAKECSA
jgi:hypothetical protein